MLVLTHCLSFVLNVGNVCGDLKTGVLSVGGFDIVISIIIIIWFLTDEMISFDENKFEKAYMNYVVGTSCATEAIRDHGSLNEGQILACGVAGSSWTKTL